MINKNLRPTINSIKETAIKSKKNVWLFFLSFQRKIFLGFSKKFTKKLTFLGNLEEKLNAFVNYSFKDYFYTSLFLNRFPISMWYSLSNSFLVFIHAAIKFLLSLFLLKNIFSINGSIHGFKSG